MSSPNIKPRCTEAEWIYWVAQVIRFPALITSWLYWVGCSSLRVLWKPAVHDWSTGAPPDVIFLRNKGLIYLLCLYSGKPMVNKLFIRPCFWWVGCSQQGRLIGENPQISAAGGGAATFDSCMDDGLLGSGNELVGHQHTKKIDAVQELGHGICVGKIRSLLNHMVF